MGGPTVRSVRQMVWKTTASGQSYATTHRRGNAEQKYMVKWDEGSSTGLVESHLTMVEEGSENLANGDDETSDLSEHLTRDAERTDDGEDDIKEDTQGG